MLSVIRKIVLEKSTRQLAVTLYIYSVKLLYLSAKVTVKVGRTVLSTTCDSRTALTAQCYKQLATVALR